MWKTQQKDFSRQIEQKLSTRDFLSSFEDTLSGLLDTEVMFLLTTFANMAIARDYDVSRSFITTVVSELISIGFVNDLTSGSCGKGCRDLISNIARKHPALLSYLMEKFSQEPNLVENSVRKLCHTKAKFFQVNNYFHAQFPCLDSWIFLRNPRKEIGSWIKLITWKKIGTKKKPRREFI